MYKRKLKWLEAKGWRVGTASTFLGLSHEEATLVEMRVNLGQALRARREARGRSQLALAKRLKSSQSRIAKMEAADRTVSIDLLVRGLVMLGTRPRDIAKALGGPPVPQPKTPETTPGTFSWLSADWSG